MNIIKPRDSYAMRGAEILPQANDRGRRLSLAQRMRSTVEPSILKFTRTLLEPGLRPAPLRAPPLIAAPP